MHTAAHNSAATKRASMTAALPKSFALFDRSWCSKEIRSMAASTLEFKSSITRTIMSEEINSDFSSMLIGNAIAIGVSRAMRVSSCLKALSSVNAYTSPHQEFLAACHALARPRFPLWGFWSM